MKSGGRPPHPAPARKVSTSCLVIIPVGLPSTSTNTGLVWLDGRMRNATQLLRSTFTSNEDRDETSCDTVFGTTWTPDFSSTPYTIGESPITFGPAISCCCKP